MIILVIIILGTASGALYWYLNQNKSISTTIPTEQKAELDNLKISFSPFSGFYPNTQFEPPSLAINLSIYEGLTKLNKDFRLEPMIAQKWSNPDDNTWRFFIDPEAKFSNGKIITADDVKFSFDTCVKAETPNMQSLANVKEVKVVNSTTVDFVTTFPDAILANKLNYLLIISQEKTTAGEEPIYVGSGHYIVKDYTPNTSLTLTRNPNYWKTPAYAKLITFVPVQYQTEAERIAGITKGEIDITSIGSEVDSIATATAQGIKMKKLSGTTVYNLYLNTEAKALPKKLSTTDNPLAKKDVREAIYMAIDPTKIADSIPAGANAENQMVNKYIVGYNKDIKRPTFNIETAKAKLIAAGYPNGFSVTIDVPTGGDPAVTIILDDLALIGIKATLNEVAQDEIPQLYDGSSAIALHGYQPETGESGTVLNNLLHSTNASYGQYNVMGYSSTELDALIEQANTTLEAKSRLSLLKQAMKLAMDNFARIPLYTTNNVYITTKNILWEPRLDESFLPTEVAGKASTN